MLKDLGLATAEQIKSHKDFFSNWRGQHGCVSSAICKNCNHLISDSLCLCSGVFICPNCGIKNGYNTETKLNSDSLYFEPSYVNWSPRLDKQLSEALERIKVLESYLDKTADGALLAEVEKLYCPRCKNEVEIRYDMAYCWRCPNEDNFNEIPLPLLLGSCLAKPIDGIKITPLKDVSSEEWETVWPKINEFNQNYTGILSGANLIE